MLFRRNGAERSGSRCAAGKSKDGRTRRRQSVVRDRALRYACEPLEKRRLFATVSWVSGTSGDWSVGSNWSTGSVPASGDDVIINVPGINITVTYSAGGVLTLPNIRTNEVLTFANGTVNWGGGTWAGAGVINVGGNFNISGSADKVLADGIVLNTQGPTIWTGTGNITGSIGATINNTGDWDIQTDADITFPAGFGQGKLSNFGTITKTVGSINDKTVIGGDQGFTLLNSGTVDIQVGTIGIGDDQNRGSTTGAFRIAGGATLEMMRGSHIATVVRLAGPSNDIISEMWDPLESTCRHASLSIL